MPDTSRPGNEDPAEGSRAVVDRELKRQPGDAQEKEGPERAQAGQAPQPAEKSPRG
jgi:hypothetical protein